MRRGWLTLGRWRGAPVADASVKDAVQDALARLRDQTKPPRR